MSGPAAVQTQTATKPTITPIASGMLQRQCACGQHTSAGGECEECKQKREGTLQRAAIRPSPVHDVPPIVHKTLHSPGQPLNAGTSPFMKPRFGHDFSAVRTYTPTILQTKLSVNEPGDAYEQEADHVANEIIHTSERRHEQAAALGAGPQRVVQRACSDCQEDDEKMAEGGLALDDDLESGIGGLVGAPLTFVQTKRVGAQSTVPLAPELEKSIATLRGAGKPLEADTRRLFEPRFGYDFSSVRVHADAIAAQTAEQIGAWAYTVGNDIVFGAGQYAPGTRAGQHLLAHELTHVVQQDHARPLHRATNAEGGGRQLTRTTTRTVQRQGPVVPAAPILAEAQIQEAIRYNQMRFNDPFDVRTVREVLGIAPFPAVPDRDFVLALAQWQSTHGQAVDGKAGADTTRTILTELRGRGDVRRAAELARDNFARTNTVGAIIFNNCSALPRFRWEVGLVTSLRNGFIIQQMDNVWNAQTCVGAPVAIPAALCPPTPRYWEAWHVDNAGNVTPNIGAVNDRWQKPAFPPGSRGNWRVTGTFFTVPRLPPAAGFALNNVCDAGNLLQSTLANPGGDELGSPAGRRTIGGTWNCCGGTNTHTRT